MDAASDAELVARCRAGDQVAWEALVDRYARYVHAIVARVYRLEGHDAEDVFQEVFARVFERLDTLRDGDALRPWIAQTARNCAVDSLRRSGREVPVDVVPEDADDGVERLDEALTVHAALERLSPECHEILDRFFCRDESYRTIGDELALPSGTIASRIARCLARLRDVIGPRETDDGRKSGSSASGGQVGQR
ncbi:MAG TPA: sigma-70 family RNA polymerase sigma factor [Gaiella sp.]|nr:sigma-70 family RNA polymerase sigma factor [Gaiella sp.]